MFGRRSLVLLAAVGALVSAPLAAQTPAARPNTRPQMPAVLGPLGNTAQFLLSRSTALELTDDQVVRLAELARAADARRQQLRDEMQAARPAERPETDAARAALRDRLQPLLEMQRAAARLDRSEAIAVLTTEQQAVAWELLARVRSRPAAAMRARPAAPAAPGPRARPGAPRDRLAPPEGG